MSIVIPLENDRYFHIYNRGINGETIFREKENYEYFMKLYNKYISSIAETFAWVLMSNHFHFVVRIKAKSEISVMQPNNKNSQVSYIQKKSLFYIIKQNTI